MKSLFNIIYKHKKQNIFLYMEGKRTIDSLGPTITENVKLGQNFKLKPKPEFIQYRIKMFDSIKQRIKDIYEKIDKPEITITLKDGKEIKGQAFVTTPLAIAKSISKNLAEGCVVANVKYTKKYDSPLGKGVSSAEAEEEQHQASEFELVDLTRPLEGDCILELITFDNHLGKEVFWHSSAHLLGQSLENLYGAWLCHGPPLESGFFYDSCIGDFKISQADYEKIQKEIKKYSQEKQQYERILLTKDEALEMFKYNPFKLQLIKSKIPDNGLTSAYRCGNLIDLCTGPHLPSADKIKGFKVTKNSSAYWLGNKNNDDLQRVYAISFPKQSDLDEYLKVQEELAKRDHRNIGPQQHLFNFTELSAGCALFEAHGTVIYNRLIELMRSEYKIRGYNEVISPNIYNSELWMKSGHYFKYKENIFFIQEEGEEHGLKPMNCPGHCLMFDLHQKSYRDLPIRMADFGVLHRNELKGALSGLTRVRRFQQDDAHIFCMPEQIEDEIIGVLDFIDYVYSVFGFEYKIELSTRPEKYLGKLEDWELAESQLKNALNKFGKQYKINEGDGAFYGPKIDFKLFDTFGRQHQCGTCQLDFQLPVRFNLQYRSKQVKDEKHEEQKQDKKKKQKVKLTAEQIQQRKKQAAEKKKQKKDEAKQPKQHPKSVQEVKVIEQKHQPIHHVQSCHTLIDPNNKNLDLAALEEKYNVVGHLKNGFSRPVIVHRAIFGSLQRFIAILCEQTGGKWDFWLSPRQIQLIPIGKEAKEFADQIYNTLILNNYSVNIDNSGDQLAKKVRNAQMESYNFIGVIGPEECKAGQINLRKRDQDEPIGKFTVAELLQMFSELKPPKSKKRLDIQSKAYKL